MIDPGLPQEKEKRRSGIENLLAGLTALTFTIVLGVKFNDEVWAVLLLPFSMVIAGVYLFIGLGILDPWDLEEKRRQAEED